MTMALRTLFLLGFLLSPCIAGAQSPSHAKVVTLYTPGDTGFPARPSVMSFTRGEVFDNWESKSYELTFGLLRIGEPPGNYRWFETCGRGESDRSVLRDLGALSWSEAVRFAAVCPRPRLQPGEQRVATVDTSAGSNDPSPDGHFVPVVAGHFYVLRIRDDLVDQYVLFRVDSLGADETCVLSWVLAPHPTTASPCPDDVPVTPN